MKQQYQNLGAITTTAGSIIDELDKLKKGNFSKIVVIYTRSMIARRSENVHTYEELQHYAENLLRGD